MTDTNQLELNFRSVQARIHSALKIAGRSSDSAHLIAVSKFHSADRIRFLHQYCGQRDFGENYTQELIEKSSVLNELQDIRWHFIGRLQSNKLRKIAQVASYVHTVESLNHLRKLAEARTELSDEPLRCFIAYSFGLESHKSGLWEISELSELLSASQDTGIARGAVVVGVMGLPPVDWEGLPQEVVVKRYVEWVCRARSIGLEKISLGMTSDLEAAISAGSNYLRIGTAIFGPRPKK